MSNNKWRLEGNVCSAPEQRQAGQGTITSVVLEVDESYEYQGARRGGLKKYKVDSWGSEFDGLPVGSKVRCEGRLSSWEKTAGNGDTFYNLGLNAKTVTILEQAPATTTTTQAMPKETELPF